MTKETRLNVSIAGAVPAAFGLIYGWTAFAEMSGAAHAFRADTGRYVSPLYELGTVLKMRLAGCVLLFIVGVGLSLFAALGGRRVR